MPLNVLEEGIKFGMKENLQIQFVLPDYPLPADYWDKIMTIDHSIVVSGNVDYDELVPKNVLVQQPDVVVFENIDTYINYSVKPSQSCVLRIDKNTLFENSKILSEKILNISRLNIIISDIDTFSDTDFDRYKESLSSLSNGIKSALKTGQMPQINILTDRMMLKQMNNCNAGVTNITLAPNGKFYICPAFYQSDSNTPIRSGSEIGSLQDDCVSILNSNLYKIEYAPLCRICDAFQCKRCIWLNNKTTYEVNTPSHEQCVVAHLERNASRKLLNELREETKYFMEGIKISEIDYLDPFDVKPEL